MSAGTTTYVEANDQYSNHAVALFEAWQRSFPALTWQSASVDRNSGLTLVSNTFVLHFSHVICGYAGSGPIDAARILEMAGFEHDAAYENMRAQLTGSTQHHRFIRH